MSVDLQLREVMVERSSGRGLPVGYLDRVYRGVARRRARKAAIVSAVAVAVLALSAGTAVAFGGRPASQRPLPVGASQPVKPIPTKSSFALLHLPAQANGWRLVQEKAELVSPDHTTFQFVFTPTQWNFAIVFDCAVGTLEQYMDVTLNDSVIPYGEATCGREPVQPHPPEGPIGDLDLPGWWQNVHRMIGMSAQLKLGVPITVTLRVGRPDLAYDPVDHSDTSRAGQFTAQAGTAVVGIYEPE